MEWLISLIVLYIIIEYIRGHLEHKRWLKDKNERTYQMVSTDARIHNESDDYFYGGSRLPSSEQLHLNIIVTDGYVIIDNIKYHRHSTGYKSDSEKTLMFVEGGYLYVSYWEGNKNAYEFVTLKNIEPTEISIKKTEQRDKTQVALKVLEEKSKKNIEPTKISIEKTEQRHKTQATFKALEEKSNEENILDNYGIHYIYHMTHIDNLNNILQNGLLSHGNQLVKTDISNQDVNDRRSIQEPVYNRSIHSYVPFYFSPRNAMLYSRKEMQNNLIILALDRLLIYQPDSLYSDGNAAAVETRFYKDLNQIQNLNWKCIHAKIWTDFQDGKRVKMAETLVFDKVPVKYIQKIFCKNNQLKQYIERELKPDSRIKVEVNQDLFF